MTLVEFILARVAKREQAARAVADIAVKHEIIRCYKDLVDRRDHFRQMGFKTTATYGAGRRRTPTTRTTPPHGGPSGVRCDHARCNSL